MRVVSFVKPTNLILLSDPWGRACLDDAVGELECQGRRVVADREGVGADNGGGDSGEWWLASIASSGPLFRFCTALTNAASESSPYKDSESGLRNKRCSLSYISKY